MCIIAHLPAKKTLPKALLQNMFTRNKDGWGIMWADRGKIFHIKEYSSFDEFYKVWLTVPRHVERAIHMRIRTAGEINKANCHPFMINDNLAMMHNGMIDTNMLDAGMSDTFNFVKYELTPVIAGIEGDILDNKAFLMLMEEREITGYSKLLFMNNHGKVLKVRHNLWSEKYGCDFSNQSSFSSVDYTANRKNYNHSASSTEEPSYNIADGYWDNGIWHPYRDYSSYDDSGAIVDATGSPLVSSGSRNFGGFRNNKYDALPKPITTEEKPVAEIKSDLYQGNKTDEEGQKAIADAEETRKKGFRSFAELQEAINKGNEAIDEDEDEDYEAMPAVLLDLEYLGTMPLEEIMDLIQDYPKLAAYVVRGLIDTCFQAGITEVTYDKAISDYVTVNSKSAVTS